MLTLDHERFTRAGWKAMGGAALGTALGWAFDAGGFPGVGAMALGAALLCAAVAARGREWRVPLLAAGVGLCAGLLPVMLPAWPWFALTLMGAGLGGVAALSRAMERAAEKAGDTLPISSPAYGTPRRKSVHVPGFLPAAAIALSAIAAPAAWAAEASLFAALLAWVPGPIAAALSGAVLGLFVACAAAPAWASFDGDPVEAKLAGAEAGLSGEFRTVARQAAEIYRASRAALVEADAPAALRSEISRTLGELATRVVELAHRWQRVERSLGDAAEPDLSRRIEELYARAEGTADAPAKRQFQLAEKTLREQLEQVARIRAGRDRVAARLQADLAVLERTRLALLGLQSSEAQFRAADLSAIGEGLTTRARELEAESEAVEEMVTRDTVRA
jgi:hypothetical protein